MQKVVQRTSARVMQGCVAAVLPRVPLEVCFQPTRPALVTQLAASTSSYVNCNTKYADQPTSALQSPWKP